VSQGIRILFLADSHLGFDLPVRPRVERRRRGHDFFANYLTALEPALRGEVDLVVHGGDVFNRSKVVATVAHQAFEPLRRIADRGIPVFIVPGNHERSRIPHAHVVLHANIHVFDIARTFLVDVRGTPIALSGFPYERRDVRTRFPTLLEQTGWRAHRAALRLLCIHHCVEGATVGPADFTFTTADDVIRVRDVPAEFAAVLSGHIHRHQVVTSDLRRRPLDTPVLYPGSVERTTTAEMDERKGFLILHADAGAAPLRWEFQPLPARPMVRQEIVANEQTFESDIRAIIAAAPHDAVLSIRVSGVMTDAQWRAVSGPRLRALAPPTMNVEIIPAEGREWRPAPRRVAPAQPVAQLSLL
jgi:DNA repair protein SbcD/Mre11